MNILEESNETDAKWISMRRRGRDEILHH